MNRTCTRSFQRTCLLTMLAACVIVMPGCSGCRKPPPNAQQQAQKKKDEEKAKKKKPFEITDLRIYPTDVDMVPKNLAKPGHWLTAQQQMTSNNEDYNAELQSSVVDRHSRELRLAGTNYRMTITRPVALPKAQRRDLETDYFLPRAVDGAGRTAFLQCRIRSKSGRQEFPVEPQLTSPMPDYQYFFVVLARNPDEYGHVKGLDCVRVESGDFNDIIYYRVSAPVIERSVPLPSHPLAWTSIAFILWDGINPNLFTPDQQSALLDWLHFGGQIIVNGPDSLDLLRGSFLEPYLPARGGESLSLTNDHVAELNEHWAMRSQAAGLQTIDLEGKSLVGVELTRHPAADFIAGTGELVAERRVGNGRIVVSGFSLTAEAVVNWRSLDSFFNNVVLRRPPREFEANRTDLTLSTNFRRRVFGVRDSRLSSTLRYFSRDLGHANVADGSNRLESDWHYCGFVPTADSGMAGWNGYSGSAMAARESLKKAAGISIPGRDFVLRVLAVYLLILVPVNWGVFRVIGRVEWAWIAAPVIAIVGGVAVARLAQLDIGFDRSLTEVAVLEVQGGYSRAHATRYTALYTSIGTEYQVTFDDTTALAQPLADPNYLHDANASPRAVSLRRDRHTTLTGFQVPSNSTDELHSEQIITLDGPISLAGSGSNLAVENNSQFALNDVGVFRRRTGDRESGEVQIAWCGSIASGAVSPIHWMPNGGSIPRFPQWDESAAMSPDPSLETDEIRLRDFVRLATERLVLRPGDVRMVGWMDEPLPGMTITPGTSQQLHRTFVVVHLARGKLEPPTKDRNLRRDLRKLLDDITPTADFAPPGQETP